MFAARRMARRTSRRVARRRFRQAWPDLGRAPADAAEIGSLATFTTTPGRKRLGLWSTYVRGDRAIHAFESDRVRPRCRCCQAHFARAIRRLGRAWTSCSRSFASSLRTPGVARSRLERAASDLERDGGGDRRVPRSATATAIRGHHRARSHYGPGDTGNRDVVEEPYAPPSSPCCDASRPVSRGARSIARLCCR